MEIPILYEDEYILAINKPAGLVVHSDGKTKEPNIADWFTKKYPKSKDVGEPIETTDGKTIDRSGIVHRLDRGTSGVLLLVKTKEGHSHIKKQFQQHTILKKYIAILYGELKQDSGIIDRPIGRSSSDFRKWSATRGARGKMREAETHWTLIAKNMNYSLIEAEPKTGRTHQIRVHFKAINHPVVCDSLYAPGKDCLPSFEKEKRECGDRIALHAFSITFRNIENKEITVISPLPNDFINTLKELNMQNIAKNKGLC